MRHLFVIDSLTAGGSQRQVVALAEGLRARGHEPVIWNYHPEEVHYRPSGVPVWGDASPKWKRFLDLRRAVRRHRADVIIAFLHSPAMVAEVGALGCGVPVVYSEGSMYTELTRRWWLTYQPHRLADMIVVNSYHHTRRLQRDFPWMKLRTIPNGVDLDAFRASPVPDRPGALRVLALSRVVPLKEIETLARAIVGLEGVEVDWAGRLGEEAPPIQAEVARILGPEQRRWRWLGARPDVPELLAQADAVVHPSFFEGMPNALCEGLAAGRPLVASAALDHPWLVGQDRGRVFEPGNADALRAALRELRDMPVAQRQAMGDAGRRFAEAELSLGLLVDRYQAVAEELVRTR